MQRRRGNVALDSMKEIQRSMDVKSIVLKHRTHTDRIGRHARECGEDDEPFP